jgi:hypothetical protein
MVVGLAATLPNTLYEGLAGHEVPSELAQQVAALPPVGSLFAAFLGYNPIATLLGPTGILEHLPPADASSLTGKTFFPTLIAQPFHEGLLIVFGAAAVMSLIAAVAAFLGGRRYVFADDDPAAVEAMERGSR